MTSSVPPSVPPRDDARAGETLAGAVVLGCFVVSGATGLVYEVVWVRMLGLVFGHTVPAVTTVLVAFMAGLAAGSLAFGRMADRTPRPLRLYGTLEIAIGASAWIVTLLTPAAEDASLQLLAALDPSPVLVAAGRFALVFTLLVVPATLMGATLPILSRAFTPDARHLGARVGMLYALNTAGAVAGTALAGYALLPALGMRATVALTAVINVAIGVVVLALDARSAPAPAAPPADAPRPEHPRPPDDRRATWIAAGGLAASGAAAMVYEIAWTRGLALVIGSSTYAFTAMLVSFLAGIALGSALASRWCRGRGVDATGFGLVQILAAAAALTILPAFEHLPDLLVHAFAVSVAPWFVLATQLLVAIAAMAVPAALLGAAFPCGVALAGSGEGRIGAAVGRLYAANTTGAIAGTVAAGFVLIPLIGAQRTVKVAVLTNVVVGAIAIASDRRLTGWRPAAAGALALLTVGGAIAMPAWNPGVMASGVAVYSNTYRALAGTLSVAQAQRENRILFAEDGLAATVTVHAIRGDRFLRINGKTDASTGRDMHTQLMLGHLPMLLHPDARSALVIGLGSGVTAAAVARHPVERIDVVEIEPAVVRASRFFERENRNVLADRRVRLTLDDARTVLRHGSSRYDVIVSEPSNPWISGIASLYSEEFYALARRRLTPGGVMVQWVQGYGIAPDDLRMVVRTFLSAFPATTVWYPNVRGDYLLVGRAGPRPLDLGRVRAVWHGNAGVREDLARRGVASPYAFLADFVLAEPDTVRYAGVGPRNTDDLLPLEFSVPLALHRDTEAANFATVTSFKREAWPSLAAASVDEVERAHVRHAIGLVHLAKDAPARAAPEFERAIAREPGHVPAMLELGKTLGRLNLPVRAIEILQAVVTTEPANAEAHVALAGAYRAQRLHEQALAHARRAVAIIPGDAAARALLASLLAERGWLDEAAEHYLTAHAQAPGDAGIADGLAALHLARGRSAEAIRVLEEALANAGADTRLLLRAGRAYLVAGRHADAAGVLERALAQHPSVAAVHADLGAAYLGLGRVEPGIDALERSLALDPAQPAARALLDEVHRTR